MSNSPSVPLNQKLHIHEWKRLEVIAETAGRSRFSDMAEVKSVVVGWARLRQFINELMAQRLNKPWIQTARARRRRQRSSRCEASRRACSPVSMSQCANIGRQPITRTQLSGWWAGYEFARFFGFALVLPTQPCGLRHQGEAHHLAVQRAHHQCAMHQPAFSKSLQHTAAAKTSNATHSSSA